MATVTSGSTQQTLQTIDSDYQSDSASDNPETPTTTSTSNPRKRKLKKTTHAVWAYARQPILGVEDVRVKKGLYSRRIWYCKYNRCNQYSCLSTGAAIHHLDREHGIAVEGAPSKVKRAIQSDLKSVFSEQDLTNKKNKEQSDLETLRSAVNRSSVHQTLLRLIVHHDLPLSAVEWPELHSFVFAINHTAVRCIWQAHQTTANHIATTFTKRRQQVMQLLQQSQSLIHLTTDTWHSPNFKELQAITAHFVDASNTRQKALLSLPELRNGHAGVEVAAQIMTTLEAYGITDRLGYITADNHGANDTMCAELERLLS